MGKAISSKLHKMRAEDLKRQVKVYQKKADYKLPASIVSLMWMNCMRKGGCAIGWFRSRDLTGLILCICIQDGSVSV